MLKDKILKFVGLLLVLALTFSITCCSGKPNEEERETFSFLIEQKQINEYAEDYEVYPTAKGETKKQGYYINLNESSIGELFSSFVLQGIVNRENPELYILSRSISSGYEYFNASEFWLEQLEKDYEGKYSLTEIKDFTSLVLKYRDYFTGVCVFPDRIANNLNDITRWEYGKRNYGDLAVANLTMMKCAQEKLLPVTQTQLTFINNALTKNGQSVLEVKSDTTTYIKDENGDLLGGGDRNVWKKATQDALNLAKTEWDISNKILMHATCFALADYDYAVQQKMFVYTRITDADATEEEKALEQEILNLTPSNTPVIGCYHPHETGAEEHNTCKMLNEQGKFWYVTYGTFNMSYTNGLPKVKAIDTTEKIIYDPTKTYVAFTFTEGDNNTYAHCRIPLEYKNENRGKFAMTWQLSQGNYDLNPNVIQFMNKNNTKYDGLAYGSSGIGYVFGAVHNKEEFYGVTQSYCEKSGINTVETFTSDKDCLITYGEYVNGLNIIGGFAGGYDNIHTENTAKIIGDSCIIGNTYYPATDPENLSSAGNLICIKFHGWNNDLNDIYNYVQKLPKDCVTVTQSQLADLLKQKGEYLLGKESVSIKADNSLKENAALVYASEYSMDNVANRKIQKDDYLVYRFNSGDAKQLTGYFNVKGDYRISVSKDMQNWTEIAKGKKTEGISVEVKIPSSVLGGDYYVLLQTENDGAVFYGMDIITENPNLKNSITVDTSYDGAYALSSTQRDSEGYLKGEGVYYLPYADNIGDIIVSTDEANFTAYVSFNGETWFENDTINVGCGTYTVVSGCRYVKIVSQTTIKNLKFTPILLNSSSFVPCQNTYVDNTCIIGTSYQKTVNSVEVASGETYLSVFALKQNLSFFEINASGKFTIKLSTDGKNYVNLGSYENNYKIDVSNVAKVGKLYVAVQASGDESLIIKQLIMA